MAGHPSFLDGVPANRKNSDMKTAPPLGSAKLMATDQGAALAVSRLDK